MNKQMEDNEEQDFMMDECGFFSEDQANKIAK